MNLPDRIVVFWDGFINVSFPCQAVQQNGQSLQHASDELQMDPELQKVVGRLKMSKNPGRSGSLPYLEDGLP